MTGYADWGDWFADWGDPPLDTLARRREALAAVLRAGVPEGWTVYASPPANLSLPCVVIGPRSPYTDPGTFQRDAIHVNATVLIPAVSGSDALGIIDGIVEPLRAAVNAALSPEISWERVDALSITTEAGADCLAAVIALTVI